MKTEVDKIEATPSKRIFLSIIADYDLNRSVCELIDNALDLWAQRNRKNQVTVDIELNQAQQIVVVTDDIGGIKKAELRNMVGPGLTGNAPTDETIGIFGVGTKRAVVALAQDVTITTRHQKDETFQIEFDDNWLKDDDWSLPVYRVDDLAIGTTVIELKKLRLTIDDEAIARLKEHLEATYAKFLQDKHVVIRVNTEALKPRLFEDWAFPPNYPPHKYTGVIPSADGGKVAVEVLAGLTKVSSPAGGEYGVYLYCNDRLIARALKTYEVGFSKGIAGLPHPSISLARIVVSLQGPAQLMPWNSSKSGINANHRVFMAMRSWLHQVVKDYTSLSRRWDSEWPDKVFKYDTGKFEEENIEDFPTATKSFLPPLPKAKLRYVDKVTQANRTIASTKPWTTGLYEGIVAADVIASQHLSQRNRIALVVLDSTLEIAFKEYLVNDSGQKYGDARLLTLFKNRSEVQDEVKEYVTFPADLWKKVDYYYNLRCKLVHERATVAVSDSELADYRGIVEAILGKLFGLHF